MTKHPSVVLVHQHMVEDGGSTGMKDILNIGLQLPSLSSCFEANLNGEYFPGNADNGYYRGIIWELWLGDNSLKSARMMIRPVDFHVDNRDP